MRPKKPKKQPQDQLFQVRLDLVCDLTNPLVKLVDRIDWDDLDEQFASLYAEAGRPANATRMMLLTAGQKTRTGSICAAKPFFSISPLLPAVA